MPQGTQLAKGTCCFPGSLGCGEQAWTLGAVFCPSSALWLGVEGWGGDTTVCVRFGDQLLGARTLSIPSTMCHPLPDSLGSDSQVSHLVRSCVETWLMGGPSEKTVVIVEHSWVRVGVSGFQRMGRSFLGETAKVETC